MAIDDVDMVWRRIASAYVVTDPKSPGGSRPSKEALKDSGDGDPMSVYCARFVERLGLDESALLADKGRGWAVAQLQVGYLRQDEEQRVEHDPVLPSVHPYDAAHTLVIGEKDKVRRERLAQHYGLRLSHDAPIARS